MPVWRCPHCATPQAEASRCWVCRRSTTSCVTCRHYRRGISGGLGLCGLDPRHTAVAATDVMACWVGATAAGEAAVPAGSRERPADAGRAASGGRAPRTFVPVEELLASRERAAVAVLDRPDGQASPVETATRDPEPIAVSATLAEPAVVPAVSPPSGRPVPGRWWLWGDPDPWPERVGQRWT